MPIAANGATCTIVSDFVLSPANKHAVTVESLREQLGRLGGSVFELRSLEATIEGAPMVPFSVLGQLRREMIEQLNSSPLRAERTVDHPGTLDRLLSSMPVGENPEECTAAVAVALPDIGTVACGR